MKANTKKALVGLCILPVLGGLAWMFFIRGPAKSRESAANRPETATVKKGAIRVTVESTGRVVSDQEIEIKCKASGEIVKLPVDVSDPVKKGDLLVQLDPENEDRSVKRAEVALAVSQARLAQAGLSLKIAERDLVTERTRAEAALKSVEAGTQEAKSKLVRVEELHKKRMASDEEMDGVQTDYAQAAADLENARARMEDLKTREVQIESKRQDIKIAEAQVESDKLSLSDAGQRLADTTVVSPIDGVVVGKNVQVGQIIASGINNVSGGTPMMTLADLSSLFVLVSVDESDIGKIQVGQRVRVTVDAYPDMSFGGQVVRVAAKGSSASNVVTFEVKAGVKSPNQRLLKPEMTANVEIVAVEKEDVLVVPVAAVERHRREQFATVLGPGGQEDRRPVATGASDGEIIEVSEGLAEGETVLIAPRGAQSRWKRGESGQPSAAQRDRMRMRMMGGGPPR